MHHAYSQRLLVVAFCCCLFGTLGCENQSTAIEDRAGEFQYSVDSLARETIDRLNRVRHSSSPAASERAVEKSGSLDPGRGGEDNRVDPGSMDGIVQDCAAKIRHLQADGDAAGAQERLLAEVAAAGKLSSGVRDEFSAKLTETLAQNK